MNGADLLIQTAVKSGIDICFANPGTTELPIVDAIDSNPGMRAVLGLFEGVCTGAADGYGRMTNKPAMTLLHLGPGLGNGIANLHNAKRAHTPLFNVIGEHASWHRPNDPLLAMDIESLAKTVSGWVRTSSSAGQISKDTVEAIAAARLRRIATLIVPSDCQWTDIEQPNTEACLDAMPEEPVNEALIDSAAKTFKTHKKTALVIGGDGLHKEGLMTAGKIQRKTGCDLLCETFPSRMERGQGLPVVQKIPYLPEMAIEMLKAYDAFIFAGARDPVAFFGYNGMASKLISEDRKKIHLTESQTNILAVLDFLEKSLPPAAHNLAPSDSPPVLGQIPGGVLNGAKAGEILASLQPENAIVIDEAITNSLSYFTLTAACPQFTLLTITGGAIGQGLPCAIGAALACPDRPVIDFQADGSAMYTIQSLWTQARENLNITTLICSNRSYDILKLEMARAGKTDIGQNALKMTDLSGIDWMKIAESQGVRGYFADTAETLAKALEASLTREGPSLIEMKL